MLFTITLTMVLFYWMTFMALCKGRALQRTWLNSMHEEYYQLTKSTVNWPTVSQFRRIPYKMHRYREKTNLTRANAFILSFYDYRAKGLRFLVLAMSFLAACVIAAAQIGQGQHKISDFVVLITY